jgi:hypothetical protein
MDQGMVPELADALAAGSVLRLPSFGAPDFDRILGSHVSELSQSFEEFGYHLEVSYEVIRYLADRLATGEMEGGVRAGMASLRDAANRVLIGMIRRSVPLGTKGILAPDDIEIPERGRGVWRE